MTVVRLSGPAAVTPGLRIPDADAAWWLSQVHLRLRREIGWCWQQRLGRSDPRDGSLPPVTDACDEALDWVRFADQKRRFLGEDPTGRHLTACLEALNRPDGATGTWATVAGALDLEPAAQFVLALALAQRLDAGLAPVFAACMNDHSRPYPTLALAQRLWDDPAEVAIAAAGTAALSERGLIRRGESFDGSVGWQAPLEMPARVANALAGFSAPGSAETMPRVEPAAVVLGDERELLAWRLASQAPRALEIVPLHGPAGADFGAWAAALAAAGARPLLRAPDGLVIAPEALAEHSTLAWFAGADLLLPEGLLAAGRRIDAVLTQCQGVPVRWFLPVSDRQVLAGLPPALLQPETAVTPLSYEGRVRLLSDGLGGRAEPLREAVEDCARRFRLEAPAIRRITAGLACRPGLDGTMLLNACRVEAQMRLGHLAQRVVPRFTAADLVLPSPQARQFAEVERAMRALTRVHYHWGTARAWSEGGLAVLFCGPPGTGKTMAAEALAEGLGLELYRIDLSQVVNKYVGETEKNLRQVFDAAEVSDCILFFDEADALFGKRTEVKDAHDRFANIEISYLLERMERFKGMAILATNRRKDLDEAFVRRLRAIIEFPVPGPAERERIWRAGIPAHVDAAALDFRFLARQFVLSGGHIRSVIFNACLQAAHGPIEAALPPGKAGRLTMRDVLVQVRRELEKLNRSATDEQFGPYAGRMAEWAA